LSGAFSFRLQALLDYKSALESGCRRDVAEAAKACQGAECRIAALHEELRAFEDVPDLRLRYLRAEYVEQKLDSEEAIFRDRQAAFQKATARLRGASQEKRALERLKQRHYALHAAAVARAEEAELEESNAQSAAAR